MNVGAFEDGFCICELNYFSSKYQLNYMLNRIKIGIDKFYDSNVKFDKNELEKLLMNPNDKPEY